MSLNNYFSKYTKYKYKNMKLNQQNGGDLLFLYLYFVYFQNIQNINIKI